MRKQEISIGRFNLTGRSMVWVTILVFIGGGLLSLAGCMSTAPDEDTNWVDLKWSETMKGMGYVPLFPPKEDVRVGDLLLCPFGPPPKDSQDHARPRFMTTSSRWASIEVANLLGDEYAGRPTWPATPDMYASPNANSEAGGAGNRSFFELKHTRYRLPSIAAGIISSQTDETNNNILIPTEAINVAMGTAWKDQKSVSLRAGNAEAYSLSLQTLLPLALEQRGVGSERRTYLKAEYQANLSLAHTAGPNSVYLSLVNEVIYMRSMDMVVQALSTTQPTEEVKPASLMVNVQATEVAPTPTPTSSTSQPVDPNAAAAVDPNAAPAVASQPASPAPVQKDVSFSGSTEAIDPALAAFMRAQLLNKTVMQDETGNPLDEYIRFISVTDSSVSLRRTWPYGLAIGVKGMQLQVNKFTGEVVSSEPMIMFFK